MKLFRVFVKSVRSSSTTIRLASSLVFASLMIGMIFISQWAPPAARADMVLQTSFSPIALTRTDIRDPIAGPVQNGPDSRLIAFYTQVDLTTDHAMVLARVKDDGNTVYGSEFGGSSGTPIDYTSMISDGADGAFIAFSGGPCQNGVCVARSNANGAAVWYDENNRVGWGSPLNASIALGSDGNLLYAANEQASGAACANILRQADGVDVWSDIFPGPGCQYGGIPVWNRTLQGGITSDGAGGMVLAGRNGIVGTTRELRRIASDGSVTWTVPLSSSNHQIWKVMTLGDSVFIAYEEDTGIYIDRFRLDDGINAWAQPVKVTDTFAAYSLSMLQTGGSEISVVWQTIILPGDYGVYVNRINTETGVLQNPLPTLVVQKTAANFKLKQSFSYAGIVYMTWCLTDTQCSVQGVRQNGALIAGTPYAVSPATGAVSRMGGRDDAACIDQVYKDTGVAPYRIQQYCFSVSPTITTPICSEDETSFVSCGDMRIGRTIRWVQVDCTADVGVDRVHFTLTAPSGNKYAQVNATTNNGDSYALRYPTLVNEAGTWSVSATCTDSLDRTESSETSWVVEVWPFSNSQKLSLYDGTLQLSKSSGDTFEFGNAGRDIASSGNIFLRPNGSTAGLAWEGLTGAASQRLHIPIGVDGNPAVLAYGTGTKDSLTGANGVAGYFNGAGKTAGGTGVSGDVISCGSLGGCIAGEFNGSTLGTGLFVETANASVPALIVENNSGPNPAAANTSAQFNGKIIITGNIESAPVEFPNCSWVDIVSSGDTICPNNGFVMGFDEQTPGVVDRLYCCGT